MKYYIDLTLIPDAETPLYFLWEKFFQQIHLAMVEVMDGDESKIGVGFPEYHFEKRHLGSKLRIFAQEMDLLEKLPLKEKLLRLTDYVHLTRIREVPDRVKTYACFQRIQTKSNMERIARRKSRYLNIELDEAVVSFKDKNEVYTTAPFIRINSLSKKEKFPLFIAMQETDKQVTGTFSSYGLSKTATVPWF